MNLSCHDDQRRELVRRQPLNGLDYLEVSDDQRTLTVYFLGKLPAPLREASTTLANYVHIEGGRRIREIRVLEVTPHLVDDPALDDFMLVRVDKYGDFSTYTLRLVGMKGIDPRYDHIDFSFKAGCPSDLDCLPASSCPPPALDQPEINYLAKDYASFRQLILDRLALNMPDWQERHIPDLGIMLVELLAYTGDYLSYYQDAVGTEAYLDTARQRISVRRHARLVDYAMHEGCNARAWVCVNIRTDVPLNPNDFYFITGLTNTLQANQSVLRQEDLRSVTTDAYEVFEPLPLTTAEDEAQTPIQLYAAHNELHFYTWGEQECCLARGATAATLADQWRYTDDPPTPAPSSAKSTAKESTTAEPPPLDQTKLARVLHLQVGDVLIFEEVVGPKRGIAADANPAHRHAVCLTRVQPSEDPVITQSLQVGDARHTLPTPVVEIEWSSADALPFALCLSTIGPAPQCAYLEHISVARGNVILVDHGRTVQPPEEIGQVPVQSAQPLCDCEGHPGDVLRSAGRFHPQLTQTPLTFSHPLATADLASKDMIGRPRRRSQRPDRFALEGAYATRYGLLNMPATQLLTQDVRSALPSIHLYGIPAAPDGNAPLFSLSDLSDPTALIQCLQEVAKELPDAAARQQIPKEARARIQALGYLRRQLSRASQDKLHKLGETKAPPPELIQALQKDLHSLLSQWAPRFDLLASQPGDRHFVVEIDNAGLAHLRFGDGEMGQPPAAGTTFMATYRVGNGVRGNVGAEAISHLVLRKPVLGEANVTVRNPLPAQGGTDPEPLAEVKLFAPTTFRKRLERAIIADDYARLAERNPAVQRAAASLTWTGSWYEADVAIDPRDSEMAGDDLLREINDDLHRYRRIGHDLAVRSAHYVSLDLAMTVCVSPHYLRGHIKAALQSLLSNRLLADGKRGLFHADSLTFGDSIYLSKLVAAAQAVPGVESVQVTRLQRQFEAPNNEIENGVLPLGPLEVARLDNDPSFPEHGRLTLILKGGR